MSDDFKISDSARTRPSNKQLVDKQPDEIFLVADSNNEYKISPILVQSVPEVQDIGQGYWANDCYVEVLKNNDENEAENSGENSATGYSIINVDPNITLCNEHLDLYLHTDETLLQPGDKFDSHESFRMYIDRNAERWLYYYSCSDSSLQGRYKVEQYTYTCVYGSAREKDRYQTKGMRKRAQTVKTNCPCKIVLKRLPYNNLLTVIFVCHHHNHELSKEAFMKLQHGRRLSPEIKEEMLDLLYLEVEPSIVRDYIHSLTKLNLNYSFFVNNARAMKRKNVERQFTSEKLAMLTEKIEDLKRTFGRKQERKTVKQNAKPRKPRKKQNNNSNVVEYQGSEVNDSLDSSAEAIGKRSLDVIEDFGENKKSRLETCLQKLSCDEETLQSVKRLQNSVQYETNPREPSIKVIKTIKKEMIQTSSGLSTINLSNETYPSEVQQDEIETTVIENPSHIDVQNNDIIELHEVSAEDLSQMSETYVVDNCALATFNIDGQEYVQCQVVYENDDTGINQEQEGYSIHYQVSNDTINKEDQEIRDNEEKDDSNVLVANIDTSYVANHDTTEISNNDTTYDSNHDNTHVNNKDTSYDGNYDTTHVNNNETTYTTDHDTTYATDHDTTQISNHDTTNVSNHDTYTTPEYEYIHRYNIDQYMTQAWFPRYIEKVAASSRISIVDMLTSIYLGKAMFRLIAINKMEGKTIRIMYLNENVPTLDITDNMDNSIRERKADAIKYCKKYMALKKKASESSRYIRCLHEAVSILTKENDKLRIMTYSQMKKRKYDAAHDEEVKKLRETKKSLQSEISDAQNEVRQLKELKNDLKKGICSFISKAVLLKQASGEESDSLNEVKRTLNNVINKNRCSSLKSSADN